MTAAPEDHPCPSAGREQPGVAVMSTSRYNLLLLSAIVAPRSAADGCSQRSDHGPDHGRATSAGHDGSLRVTNDRSCPFGRTPQGSPGHGRSRRA
jgi:hypothetical protein